MALSALALCSRALLKIGAQPVASLDEGTAEAEVAANLYPGIRDALLSVHPWTFATAQATLRAPGRHAARGLRARLPAARAASCARCRPAPPGARAASSTACRRTGCSPTRPRSR